MNRKLVFTGIVVAGISSAFIAANMNKGVDISSSMDKTANPRDDFYQYANGKWCKENPVPAAEARWTSFNILAEKNNDLLRKILADAAADKAASFGSARQKVGDFYNAAMDTIKLEREGLSPAKNEFSSIDEIKNTDDVMMLIARFHQMGIGGLFSFDVSQDVKRSDQYICYMALGGLGLPDRDYYL